MREMLFAIVVLTLLIATLSAVRAQQIHCTSTRVGNTTYTTCR